MIVDNFLQYLRVNTQSNPAATADEINALKDKYVADPSSLVQRARVDSPRVPTSEGQFVLADIVARQLQALGCEVTLDSNAIVVATLPSNIPDHTQKPVVLFAHLDTATDQPGQVNPQVVHYQGGDIPLSTGPVLKASEFPELANYIGDDIVVTDGTSLLGADDKAAITAAVQCIEEIKDKPHGEVKVVLVPDEEIGLLGAKALDVAALNGEFGICLDCCGAGEYVVNNWNAGHAFVEFRGRSAHPMNSKNNLKNALLMATDFISMLPAAERPEHTEGEEGYFWVKSLKGDTVAARLEILLRDFDRNHYEQRKDYLLQSKEMIETKYSTAVKLTMEDDYPSISNYFDAAEGSVSIKSIQEKVAATMLSQGIAPKPLVMRGGYDGCVITGKGLPTVNMFTGAHNFHSIYEYQPLGSLRKAVDMLVSLTLSSTAKG